MNTIQTIIENQYFLIILASVMTIVNICKKHGLLDSVYYILQRYIKSDKLFLSIMSCIYGVIPIPGRISIATGLFDTCTCTKQDRSNLGILSYLATHHYYLWSPIEKSVLIVLAGIGIAYVDFLAIMFPYICIFIALTIYYIWFHLDKIETIKYPQPAKINLIDPGLLLTSIITTCFVPEYMLYIFVCLASYYVLKYKYYTWFKELNKHLMFTVALVIACSTIVREHTDTIFSVLQGASVNYSLHVCLIISFLVSFILGSSSKFAAATALMVSVFGIEYLAIFYIFDYCGYMLSPMHKCVTIGKTYFGTNLVDFYKSVGIIIIIMITTALLNTFILQL